jgi:hypothetical protein
MGALGWWAAFFVMPLAVRWEFPLATVDRIPVFGFCLGIALGIAMGYWENVRNAVGFGFGAIVVGWLAWLFIVMGVGFVLTVALDGEAFDSAMETVNTVAAWIAWALTLAVIAVGVYALLYEGADALKARLRTKRGKTP